MTFKNWFITGSSRGLGREWLLAALERGDRVAATARRIEDLDDVVERYGAAVLPIQLDVTDRAGAFDAVRDAAATLGTLDVVVNNAGYGQLGMVEELTEDELRDQMETNLFGAVWVTQAALPIMRQQRSGRILQVTSIGGIRAFPGFGAYHASKWALEGLTQALAQEVGQFGVRMTLIEPGAYATEWGGISARHSEPLAAYDGVREPLRPSFHFGDPSATRAAILAVVDSDDPPLRLLLGKGLPAIRDEYAERVADWERWEDLSVAAFGAETPRRR